MLRKPCLGLPRAAGPMTPWGIDTVWQRWAVFGRARSPRPGQAAQGAGVVQYPGSGLDGAAARPQGSPEPGKGKPGNGL